MFPADCHCCLASGRHVFGLRRHLRVRPYPSAPTFRMARDDPDAGRRTSYELPKLPWSPPLRTGRSCATRSSPVSATPPGSSRRASAWLGVSSGTGGARESPADFWLRRAHARPRLDSQSPGRCPGRSCGRTSRRRGPDLALMAAGGSLLGFLHWFDVHPDATPPRCRTRWPNDSGGCSG